MKYFSTLLFALCLGWTWKVIHTQGTVSFNTHAALQTRLAEIISHAIETLKPASANFEMEYLWTELLPNGQVKAHFSYKFDEVDSEKDIVQNGLEGYAILEKQRSVAEQEDKWNVIDIKTQSGSLNFREGMVISPNQPQNFEPAESQPQPGLQTPPQTVPLTTPTPTGNNNGI